MNQRSFLLALLCLGLVLSSCKKEGANASGDTREAVWKEISKISAVAKFSRIDTLKVNQNIDKGILTIAKLRETFTSLSGWVPISGNTYTEDTYLGDNSSCGYDLTFTMWGLKSVGYPYRYRIVWGGIGWDNLTYAPGETPNSNITYTTKGATGTCGSATGLGTLKENHGGLIREWNVETNVSLFAANLWRANMKFTLVE